MSRILHIDTSGPVAWVVLAEAGRVLQCVSNPQQNDHAAFLHPALRQVMDAAGWQFADLQAIAACYGPGSYTGIRVALAAAKGICFAAGIPLITLSSLEISARALRDARSFPAAGLPLCYCPMIDARRMEVFTAVYDEQLQEIMPPAAQILQPDSYVKILLNNRVVFSGTGAAKWQRACIHENALFAEEEHRDRAMACLSWEKAQRGEWSDTAAAEPLYLKEFFTTAGSSHRE